MPRRVLDQVNDDEELLTMIRRFLARMKDRRTARRARRLANAHRRAAEGYDEPPMSFGSGS